jgi:hypothetical protein
MILQRLLIGVPMLQYLDGYQRTNEKNAIIVRYHTIVSYIISIVYLHPLFLYALCLHWMICMIGQAEIVTCPQVSDARLSNATIIHSTHLCLAVIVVDYVLSLFSYNLPAVMIIYVVG